MNWQDATHLSTETSQLFDPVSSTLNSMNGSNDAEAISYDFGRLQRIMETGDKAIVT